MASCLGSAALISVDWSCFQSLYILSLTTHTLGGAKCGSICLGNGHDVFASGIADQRCEFGRGNSKRLKKEQSLPFLLSEGLPTIPYKIVKKITNGEFVDMAELLRDNIEAERRASVVEGQNPPKAAHTARREIPDLLSWVQCFGTFIAIMASVYPGKVRQLLAYQTLIIREGRRLGGNGWRSYNTMFRQQAALDPAVDWSKINSTLYAVSFVAQPGTRVRSCSLCMESDHREEDCSL